MLIEGVFRCLVIFHVKAHGPTATTTKSVKKKGQNFLYSFLSRSLKNNFMYTNLNMSFYKYIMAGAKSCPPKPQWEIPVGLQAHCIQKYPFQKQWAIYCNQLACKSRNGCPLSQSQNKNHVVCLCLHHFSILPWNLPWNFWYWFQSWKLSVPRWNSRQK